MSLSMTYLGMWGYVRVCRNNTDRSEIRISLGVLYLGDGVIIVVSIKREKIQIIGRN